MHAAGILTDTSNQMSSFSNNGIKTLWNARLRSYRGASIDGTGPGAGNPQTPLRRSSSSVPLSKAMRTPSTGSRSTDAGDGLTDSDHRASGGRPASAVGSSSPAALSAAAASSSSTPLSSGAAIVPRGRSSTVSSLKRRASSSALMVLASANAPPSPQHQRQRSASPLTRPLFRDRFLLMELGPHEPAPLLTLVLDLDETLVSNRSAHLSRAVLRPYCLHVLHALRHMQGLEIVLWTASTKETASPVVDQLQALGPIFDDIIFRSDLWFTEGIHTKDLRQLGRDVDHVLIVDNAANCCKLNPRNALLIEDFHGFRHEEDAALVNVYYIVEALLKLSKEKRTPVREGLAQLAEEGNLCHSIVLPLPEVWKSYPLSEIAPLKIPPHGAFFRANTPPPSRSIMKYWKY